MNTLPAGRLRPGDRLASGLIVVAVADCMPERLPGRYGGGVIRRALLVLGYPDGTPVAELRILSVARLETAEPRDL